MTRGQKYHFETLQLHVGQECPDPASDARAVPIYATSSYVFRNARHAADRFALRDPGNIYGRLTNSTVDVFEKRIAALEGGSAAVATASGAAAVAYTIQALAHSGDNIVAARTVYGGTYNLLEHTLPHYGIAAHWVDPYAEGALTAAIDEHTKALYIETLGNPSSSAVDLEAWAAAAHDRGLPLVVDNTFATPYLVRPLTYGADIVIHSATKFINGHGTAVGGVIVDGGRFDWCSGGRWPWLTELDPSYHGLRFAFDAGAAPLAAYIRAILLRDTGAALSPFHAFLFLQGLETLSLRVERHVTNALNVVNYLQKHPKVRAVHHPSLPGEPGHEYYGKYFPRGGGSIFTFELEGGRDEAWRLIDHLQIFSLLANVADAKSLVIHPASTTHAQLTEEELREQRIGAGTVRLSVGLEHIDDLIGDLEQALAEV
ncbi:MAG: O-acetylhomoserine aminocarboxypropyltransferase/cysteine synthase family protein [Anaerovoracaceae bacterium]|jgi:O-acetylhomoserine (thiol)-lyase